MKFRLPFMREYILVCFLVISSQSEAFSRERDSIRVKPPGLHAGISAGPTQTLLKNEGTASIPGLQSGKMNSYAVYAEIGYFFTKHIGLSTGIGYIPYKTELSLDAYQDKFNATDSEMEMYEKQIFGSSISEVQKIEFLTVPVNLNIRLPISGTVGFFIQPGVSLSFPLQANYSSSGTFTYKGYYPAYNVLLQNLPAYGFPTNKSTADQGPVDVTTFCVFGLLSAGFDFFVHKKIQILASANYTKSLSDISVNSAQDQFHLSPEIDQISSFMSAGSKVSAESAGITIGLRYYFK